MPRVDLHSPEDYASIHYITNTPYSNVGGFDPDKPTIVLLHPAFLDATWLDLQMGDTRFHNQFNLIAFDMRSTGHSTCRPSGRHDSWVDAADLAFCFQKLHLPPSHIFAPEGTSIYCALRFAVLFPELCLSLTLVNVPAPAELKWIYKNIDELVHSACFAGDMSHFEEAAFECIEFIFGPDSDPDLVDELVAHWELNHAPCQRVRVAETASLYINRAQLSSETLSLISQPVLIIQGEKNELCPMKYADKLVSALTGVEGGPVLYDVKGATMMISVVPGPASMVNNVFYKFLTRLPHRRSDLVEPESSIRDRMKMALGSLAEIMEDPDMASLDPLCSLSFCCLTPEVIKGQTDLLKHYSKDIGTALNPMGVENEGRPLRKYD
ncbi:alpha/beta-hydrolase [Pholiota conissans]|uniref:Alpha/beta-hydrolase n=1 Tax=Pholiota conissans TaxID=109636 RepID=A0A9P5Z8M1_9AGAR|nr:alpha/beta-hydrolase [Pholiota conissans]